MTQDNGGPGLSEGVLHRARRYRRAWIMAGLVLAASVLAEPPPGNLQQLDQLNRANAAALDEIQRPPGFSPALPPPSPMKRQLDRQQRADQQRLQDRQRSEMLWLNQRARIHPGPGLPHSLQGIDMQQRFQQEQQYQLYRFRREQLSPLR